MIIYTRNYPVSYGFPVLACLTSLTSLFPPSQHPPNILHSDLREPLPKNPPIRSFSLPLVPFRPATFNMIKHALGLIHQCFKAKTFLLFLAITMVM